MSIASPALAEQYAASPAPGWRALSEVIEMIEPPVAEQPAGVLEHEERAGQADVDHPTELGERRAR